LDIDHLCFGFEIALQERRIALNYGSPDAAFRFWLTNGIYHNSGDAVKANAGAISRTGCGLVTPARPGIPERIGLGSISLPRQIMQALFLRALH
jgi:hypothetical protein